MASDGAKMFFGALIGGGIVALIYEATKSEASPTPPPGQFNYSVKITNWGSITTDLGTAPVAAWSAVYPNLQSTTGQTHIPLTSSEIFNGNPGANTKATIALVDASGNFLGIFYTQPFTPVSGKVYTINCWDGSVSSS